MLRRIFYPLLLDKRTETSLDEDFVRHGVSVDALFDMAPNFEERRNMLSRDALASAEGMRRVSEMLQEHKVVLYRPPATGAAAAFTAATVAAAANAALSLPLLLVSLLSLHYCRCRCR